MRDDLKKPKESHRTLKKEEAVGNKKVWEEKSGDFPKKKNSTPKAGLREKGTSVPGDWRTRRPEKGGIKRKKNRG